MDGFMDKLVDKMNRQGRDIYAEDTEQTGLATADYAAIEKNIGGKLDSFSQNLSARISNDMQETLVSATQEMMAAQASSRDEMIEKLSAKQQETLLSATQEMMAAQASSRDEMIEKLSEWQQANLLSATEELIAAQASVRNDMLQLIQNQSASSEDVIDTITRLQAEQRAELVAAITKAQAANMDEIITMLRNNPSGPVTITGSEDMVRALAAEQESSREQLADHMHKESVKVYRNVQAAMEESFAKNNGRLEGIVRSGSSDIVAEVKKALKEELSMLGNMSNSSKEEISPVTKAMLALLGLNLIGQLITILWIFKII